MATAKQSYHLIHDLAPKAAKLLEDATNGAPAEQLGRQLAELHNGQRLLAVSRDCTQIWFRAQKCESESGYPNVRRMRYRDGGSPDYGRASMPLTPVHYSSWNLQTALRESRAKAGEVFQVIRVRVRAPAQFYCNVVGEIECYANSGASLVNSDLLRNANQLMMREEEPAYLVSRRFTDSFLADYFRRDSDREAAYRLTAIFANRVFLSCHGLMYPSVESTRSINLAVHANEFDQFFEIVTCDVFRVLNDYGYGLYEVEWLRHTAEIDKDGMFMWDSRRQLPSDTTGLREFKGWVDHRFRDSLPPRNVDPWHQS